MIAPRPIAREQSATEARAARSLSLAARYRRSQVYGLLLIAAVILAVVLFRADTHALFPPGWWR